MLFVEPRPSRIARATARAFRATGCAGPLPVASAVGILPPVRLPGISAALLGLAACASPPGDVPKEAAGSGPIVALVALDEHEWLGTASQNPQQALQPSLPQETLASASARFVRLGDALTLAKAERMLGTLPPRPPLGACASLDELDRVGGLDRAGGLDSEGGPGDLDADEVLPALELVGVGELALRRGRDAFPLALRTFPDVAERVSGVFYTSDEAPAVVSRAPSEELFLVAGPPLDQAEGVRLGVSASPLEGVTIEGVALGDDGLEVRPRVTRLRWTPSPPAASAGETEVWFDFTAPTGGGLRCSFRDEGEASADLGSLGELGELHTTETVLVAVRRVQRSVGPQGDPVLEVLAARGVGRWELLAQHVRVAGARWSK